jgi:hypothetical protein
MYFHNKFPLISAGVMPGNKWICASETNFRKKHHKKPRDNSFQGFRAISSAA